MIFQFQMKLNVYYQFELCVNETIHNFIKMNIEHINHFWENIISMIISFLDIIIACGYTRFDMKYGIC